MDITFVNNKCARNVKRTIKTSDMALHLTESVESFAIAILDVLVDCEFPRLAALYNELRFFDSFSFHVYTTAICHFIAA